MQHSGETARASAPSVWIQGLTVAYRMQTDSDLLHGLMRGDFPLEVGHCMLPCIHKRSHCGAGQIKLAGSSVMTYRN